MATCEKGIPFDRRLGCVLQRALGLSGRTISRIVVTCEVGKPVIVTYDEVLKKDRELELSEAITKEQVNV